MRPIRQLATAAEAISRGEWELSLPISKSRDEVSLIIESGDTEDLSEKTVLLAKNGSERIISASGAPIFDKNDKPTGVILVFRDITENVKMQEELLKSHKLKSVGILAGGIAHDFNNILTAILGNISLAKMHANPDDSIFLKLEETEKASLRAKNLTKQLLTFSRGGEPIKKTTSVIEIIRDSAQFALTGSKNSCEFHLDNDLWPVEADDGQISQVIHNLIINANQAMEIGGKIKVYAKNLSFSEHPPIIIDKRRFIQISIKDQGKGITRESQQKIFDPYFTTKQSGSGLGLASAYSIVKKHKGYITVESVSGQGAIFNIYLPASEKSLSPPTNKKEHVFMGSGRILVMDDEEIVREVTGVMLDSLGYDIDFAQDGLQAIAMYKKAMQTTKPYNAVLMDLTIPGGMGGMETIAQLCKIDPKIKAIVSSGYSNNPIMANYQNYGFVAVVSKPYNLEHLSRTLYTVIGE